MCTWIGSPFIGNLAAMATSAYKGIASSSAAVVLPRQCIWTLPPYLGCVEDHNLLNCRVPIFWVDGLGDLCRNINTNMRPRQNPIAICVATVSGITNESL